jgi:N-dimethylarginine dimethylaminohydrolase
MSAELSEVGRLTRVLVKHARDAFVSQEVVDGQWSVLNFVAPPDCARAIDEFDAFLDIIRRSGTEIVQLPRDASVTIDSIYARDASVLSPEGIILASMGKPERATEPAVQSQQLQRIAMNVVGRIQPPGRLEGGDVIWLDGKSVAVGWGYRTNADGIRQFREHLGESIECLTITLPHWRGSGDVMHLMSLISPVDKDLAVVYSRLMPVPFREDLLRRGYTLVEVPDEEFETMGTNVLALAPRMCVILNGNPRTRTALEKAGAAVYEYEGREISLKGGGGPTCLTRPLTRLPWQNR